MNTNLFPAILIAGPPHCGKSVLAYLLTQHLRKMNTPHYLFRAAPDGEGDWFQEGDPDIVRPLKDKYKGRYSIAYTSRVRSIIENRPLPFIVDAGGLPQGEDQFDILRACTHSILLYRKVEEYTQWREQLCSMNLFPVAEVQSTRCRTEQIVETHPVLHGIIQGLSRHNAKTGPVFGALLDRVAGICHYDEAFIEKSHFDLAPYPVLKERTLGCEIGISKADENPFWNPSDLIQIQERIKPGVPIALYGRGPVWLAAAVSTYSLPGSAALFDARYGWLKIPKVRFGEPMNGKVQVTDWVDDDAQWMEINLMGIEVYPGDIDVPQIEGKNGLVLSGELPRWYYAALARAFAPKRDWIGIDVPAQDYVVIIHCNHEKRTIGDPLKRPKFSE